MLISLILLITCVMSIAFISKYSIIALFSTLSIALLYLIYCYTTDDTSLLNVYLNSSFDTPSIFKIAASWSNHEGSMLMWSWMLAACNLWFYIINNKALNQELVKHTMRIQSLVTVLFILVMLYSSNPFIQSNTTSEGLGFNPILQDMAVIIHPPILFIGYSLLSLVFSISVAALLASQYSKDWIKLMKPWLTCSWSSLSIGIGLGSWWAYRELGWGGFWFWDPVENISLMPWLIGTSLLHSIHMTEKFNILNKWNLALGIIGFSSALLGTFLIRSGIILSVHSFSFDDYNGMYLALLSFAISAPPLIGLAVRKNIESNQWNFPIISTPTGIMLNNITLCLSYTSILLSIAYPVAYQLLYGQAITIGIDYYNTVFTVMWIPLMLLCGAFGISDWNKRYIIIKYLVILILTFYLAGLKIQSVLLGNALFCTSSSIIGILRLPKRCMHISHLGIAILVAGISICTTWQKDKELYLNLGEKTHFMGHEIKLKALNLIERENHKAVQAILEVDRKHRLLPESRFFSKSKIITPEADIIHYLSSDLYLMIGDLDEKLGVAMKIYHRPGMMMIWIGIVALALGPILRMLINKLQNN